MKQRAFVFTACVAVLAASGTTRAHAQTGYAASATRGVERATVVAGTILLPVGSRHDQNGFEGTAWLAAHTLASQARQALAGSGAAVSVAVGRSRTAITLTTLPASWPAAWAILDAMIFDRPYDAAIFDDERQRARTQLTFRMGSPVTDFERESFQQLSPPSDPWASAPVGNLESLEVVTAQHGELLRRERYQRDASVVAVAGAVPPRPPPSVRPNALDGAGALAWVVGDRTVLTQDVTSAWISVAYPVPAGIDLTTLEFVVDIIQDVLDPVPPDPEQYNVDVRIEEAPGGPTVVTQVAVVPEAADRWEARAGNAVATLMESPPAGEFFDWARRRFRSRRLLADAPIEQMSARMAADLLRDGVVRNLDEDIWNLTEASVAAALRSFGEKRILRLGPDLGLGGR